MKAFSQLAAITSIVILLFFMYQSPLFAADVNGAKDHPSFGRLSGSEILIYNRADFDSYTMPTGRAKRAENDRFVFTSFQTLEGIITKITYIAPDGAAPAEVIGNYKALIKENGGKILYEAADDGLGKYDDFVKAAKYEPIFKSSGGTKRFLAAKMETGSRNIYISLYAAENRFWGFEIKVGKEEAKKGRTYYQLDIIEEKTLATSLVVMKAEEMESNIARNGKVALYGILFDHDKSDIKPDSKPALEEIAKLMKLSPEIKFLVVGHTDNQGDLEYNLLLSERRAKAVTKTLSMEYGIATSRLSAHGVGMLAPVASNDSEEGKAKNRRVELVKQ